MVTCYTVVTMVIGNMLGAVHILRNHFLSVSRPPPPFRNQIRHWIEQKLYYRNHSGTPLPFGDYVI